MPRVRAIQHWFNRRSEPERRQIPQRSGISRYTAAQGKAADEGFEEHGSWTYALPALNRKQGLPPALSPQEGPLLLSRRQAGPWGPPA